MSGPSDTLRSLAIADINSAIENGRLYVSSSVVEKSTGSASQRRLRRRNAGSALPSPQRSESARPISLATSVGCKTFSPRTSNTGGDGEEYAPETLLICDHTCATGVNRFSFPTYSFQDLRFASKTVRRAAALAFLNAIIFSVVECRWKVLNALRRSRSAARHSSVHHGTGIRRGAPDVLGICLLAARNSTLVKWWTDGSWAPLNSDAICSSTFEEKSCHSAFLIPPPRPRAEFGATVVF